jgi:hypothetical protein
VLLYPLMDNNNTLLKLHAMVMSLTACSVQANSTFDDKLDSFTSIDWYMHTILSVGVWQWDIKQNRAEFIPPQGVMKYRGFILFTDCNSHFCEAER